jgi:beta-glucosidase
MSRFLVTGLSRLRFRSAAPLRVMAATAATLAVAGACSSRPTEVTGPSGSTSSGSGTTGSGTGSTGGSTTGNSGSGTGSTGSGSTGTASAGSGSTGSGSTGSGSTGSGSTGSGASGSTSPDGGGGGGLAGPAPCNPDTANIESQVSTMLASMSQAEKLGQMVMADIEVTSGMTTSMDLPDVTGLFLGGVLASGNDGNTNKASDWLNITGQYRTAAGQTPHKIPLLFGIDAVHGNGKAIGATIFPESIALGATRDAALVQQVAAATAAEVAAMGFTITFAPDSDVGQDERWGRTYESFGEDPTLVSPLVGWAFNGFQNGCWNNSGPTLLGSAKHFIAAGGTSWGTGTEAAQTGFAGIDRGNAMLDDATIQAVHLPPFQAAMNAGAMVILVSYSSVNGTLMINDSQYLTDVMKTQQGFKGVMLSDWDALPASSSASAIATSINAGMDMIMLSSGASTFINTLSGAVPGMIPQSRIDDAVTRILRAKYVAGLFTQPAPTSAGLSVVGSSDHLKLASQAVSESLVLLQNNNKRLPLSKSAKVVVAGLGGNDMGVQAGGWTQGWQGAKGLSGIPGTTIFAAMQSIASSSSNVTYSADGSNASGNDVGVVVLYENPYAEYCGDVTSPDFNLAMVTRPMYSPCGQVYDDNAASILSNMQKANIPLVLVLVSGRPMLIQSYLSTFDAVVEAWLPGSAGDGVANVLYGNTGFTGVLPKSWPTDTESLPISSLQDGGATPLFAYGFGLKQ